MGTNPYITIVVPLYNTEDYILKCLDSIFAQTYKAFECIVVDDGSTDNSLKICLEYANKENRLRIIHIEKSGVCKARNIGIKMAKGSWITFIDSDDYIDSNYLESFIPYLKSNTFCTHRALKKIYKGDLVEDIGIKNANTYHDNDGTQNYELLNKNHLIFASSCFKMYSKDILYKNSILFDESIICVEDRIFVAEYLLAPEVHNIKFIDCCGYNYVIHSGSSTTRQVPLDMYADASMKWYKLLNKLNKKFNINNPDIIKKQKKFIKNQLVDVILGLFNRSVKLNYDRLSLYNHVKNYIDKDFNDTKLDGRYHIIEGIIAINPSFVGYIILRIRFLLSRKTNR